MHTFQSTAAPDICALGRHLGLDLRYPLLQAPMAGSQSEALAIAVSDAGALGALPCAMLSPGQLQSQLTRIRQQPGRAVNVNFFCHRPPEPDLLRQQQWQRLLQPFFDELQIPDSERGGAAGRQPFNAEFLQVIAPFRPEVVSFHFGLPEAGLLAPIRAWGGKILASATTLEEGRWLEQQGVDLVIAQGIEAGGHRGMFLSRDLTGQCSTETLVRQLVAELKCPVIAAGGICGPQQVRRMLALGAVGVQCGTAFLLADEAGTSALHRKALTSSLNQQTQITNLFSGRPARGMVNRLMQSLGPIVAAAPDFPLAGAEIGALRRVAEARGCWDFSPLWAGTGAAQAKAGPVADIISALMKDSQPG